MRGGAEACAWFFGGVCRKKNGSSLGFRRSCFPGCVLEVVLKNQMLPNLRALYLSGRLGSLIRVL